MITSPEYKFQWLDIKETDIVSIHYESTPQIQRAFDWLKQYKCKRFLAINPATPVYVLEELLDHIDGINILMVNPGFSGQKIVPTTLKKTEKIINLLKENNREDIIIQVDGNITCENGRYLKDLGANIFVAGTSSIFRGNVSQYEENIKKFKLSIDKT
jgi:ribulose-phosphate 3-epimerase